MAQHLAFSSDHRELRVSTRDGHFVTCRLGTSQSGQLDMMLDSGFRHTLNADGSKAAYVDKQQRPVFHIIELPTGKGIAAFSVDGHSEISSLLFSREDKFLAAAADDGKVFIFNLINPTEVPLLLDQASDAKSSRLIRMAFSSDDLVLFTGDERGVVRRCTIAAKTVSVFGNVQREIDAMETAGDSLIISAGGTLFAMNRQTGAIASGVIQNPYRIYLMRASRDGETLFAFDAPLRFMSVRLSPAPADPLIVPNHAGGGNLIRLSQDGGMVGFTKEFRSITLEYLGKEPASRSFDVSRLFDGHRGVLFAYSAGTLVAGGQSGILIWHLADHSEPEYMSLGEVRSVAVSDDGAKVAVATAMWFDVWDLHTKTRLLHSTLKKAYWPEVIASFSGDGEQVAWTDREARVWRSWIREHRSTQLTGLSQVYSLVFSPDGNMLAAGAADGRIGLWRTAEVEKEPVILGGHDREVISLAFGQTSATLVSGGRDGHVKIWDLKRQTALPIDIPTGPVPITSVALRRDGSVVAVNDIWFGSLSSIPRGDSGARYPFLRFWPSTEMLADRVCSEVWRNLTDAEWTRYIGQAMAYRPTCPNMPGSPSATSLFNDEM